MTAFFTSALLTALCLIFLAVGKITARHLGNVLGGLAARRHLRFGYTSAITQWYDFVRKQTRLSARALLMWVPTLIVSGFLLAFFQQLAVGLLWGRGWFAFVMVLVTAFYALKAALSAGTTLKLSHGAAIRDREVCMAGSNSAVGFAIAWLLAVL